jgi:hypothetical protein
MLTIDKNITPPSAIPAAAKQLGAYLPGHMYKTHPFLAMSPGDSFMVPAGVIGDKHCQAARQAGKKTGMKFTARTVEGGVRIWRMW